ncbi:MAG TPA: LEA type 2 family protein [Steroidobacteraceae bacterium]|jgi:LEA14-like dessication related protein|nr:LEA type 2 family protein [Steroidobacteraceae bacterium]HNS27017.1 LEA type 2 family protein [Steroidobacteraceae bacterium]
MRILIATALAVLLSSCAATRLETPHLQLVNIEMMESELFEQRFKVRMRVQNPNDRALPVQGISAKMQLQGEDFAQGVAGEAFTVPAFGEAEFDMVLRANVAGAILRLLSSMKDKKSPDKLDYRVVGKLSLSSGFLRSVPFEESGSFNLGELTKGSGRP